MLGERVTIGHAGNVIAGDTRLPRPISGGSDGRLRPFRWQATRILEEGRKEIAQDRRALAAFPLAAGLPLAARVEEGFDRRIGFPHGR
jgi:hypothetical protein